MMIRKLILLGSLLLVLVFWFTSAAIIDERLSLDESTPAKSPPSSLPSSQPTVIVSATVGIVSQTQDINYDTNRLTQWYEETCGLNLQFTVFEDSLRFETLNLIIRSNEALPEALIGFGFSARQTEDLSRQKILLPLANYYNKYAVHINQALEKTGRPLLEQIRSADGETYYVPSYLEKLETMFPLHAVINKTWLDRLELPIPASTDAFYETLRQFKDNDPNANGLADEIPFLGSSAVGQNAAEWLMNAYTPNNLKNRLIWDEDGRLDVTYNKDAWRQGLRYLNRLIQEGLLPPISFVQSEEQLKLVINRSDNPTVGISFLGDYTKFLLENRSRQQEYVFLPPLLNQNGRRTSICVPQKPLNDFCITKDAQNPIKLFQWADFMWSSQATLRAVWGEEGSEWVYATGQDHSLLESIGFPAIIKPIQQHDLSKNSCWAQRHPMFGTLGLYDGRALLPGQERYPNQLYRNAVADSLAHLPAPPQPPSGYSISAVQEMEYALHNYVNKCMVQFIIGEMDIERDWEKYLTELSNIGLDSYLDLLNSIF